MTMYLLQKNLKLFAVILTVCLFAALFDSMSANAQENETIEGFAYSPEGCDFAVTFPSEPGKGRRCPSDPDEPCQEVARFTKIYSAQSTVKAEISCRPIAQDLRETYTQDVMERLINGMADNMEENNRNIIYREMEEENVKIAALSGMRQTGYNNSIYTAQIWVGPNSVLVFEGDLIGGDNDQADDLFAGILSSLTIKNTNGEENQEDVDSATEE